MEYVKGMPYFCQTDEKIKSYPYLDADVKCDILIVGGGIDGAIANYYLSKKYDVVLVDRAKLGYGCTSCATALLEYQLDDFASDLLKVMSEQEIVMAYQMGLSAFDKIEDFISKHGNHCHFLRRPTFLFTNSIFSKKDIEEEYDFRKKHNFDCFLFTENDNPFPFPIKAGIYCENGGCELNPYLFTRQMIDGANNQDRIFEHTAIVSIKNVRGGIEATTNYGYKIYCKKVLFAGGFNFELFDNKNLCERFITYSIVTSPCDYSWKGKALIHDATSPYHYLRTLPDGRIIFGGEDIPFTWQTPIDEKVANKKYEALEKDFFTLFPDLKDKVKIDYKFCGAFGTTTNNLGLIGQSEEENILLFISCGANGIINAMKGIEIIEDILEGKSNKLEKLFLPTRE